jgi:hypothetical protein
MQCKCNPKESRSSHALSNETDFKSKVVKRKWQAMEGGQYMMI